MGENNSLGLTNTPQGRDKEKGWSRSRIGARLVLRIDLATINGNSVEFRMHAAFTRPQPDTHPPLAPLPMNNYLTKLKRARGCARVYVCAYVYA